MPSVDLCKGMSGHSDCSCSEDDLWNKADVKIEALESIVSDHFDMPSKIDRELPRGALARVYLISLADGQQVVARVARPIRKHYKTECEVATMCFIRGLSSPIRDMHAELIYTGCTTIPIPKVYLYCSNTENPVNAEFIIMEYMSGVPLEDVISELPHAQCIRFVEDLAKLVNTLFRITSKYSGSLVEDLSPPLQSYTHSLRYKQPASDTVPIPAFRSLEDIIEGRRVRIGPLNDLIILENPEPINLTDCGPWETEEQFVISGAKYGGERTPPSEPLMQKLLEFYRILKPIVQSEGKVSYPDLTAELYNGSKTFHFAHGDLSNANILVHCDTGAITAVLDWEASGFYPPWLACSTRTYTNDDVFRCIMSEGQDELQTYDDNERNRLEQVEDAHYLKTLKMLNPELYYHDRVGSELRAVYTNIAHPYYENALLWLIKYRGVMWDTSKRGRFPIKEMKKWTYELDYGVSHQRSFLGMPCPDFIHQYTWELDSPPSSDLE